MECPMGEKHDATAHIVHGPHLMARMGEVVEEDVNRMIEVANILSKVNLVTPFSVIDDGMTQ